MNTAAYEELLAGKIVVAPRLGIKIDREQLHPSGKPHQKDIVEWALDRGAALVAADCGMGKTHMGIDYALQVLKYTNSPVAKFLIVTELGAKDVFVDDDPEISDGARMGVKIEYVEDQTQALASSCDIVLTNYERVRMGNFDFSAFVGVWLDEGNYIKNMASETTNMLAKQLAKVQFKVIATATPSPNETLELVNYAHALGVCDRGQILTRFFKRNSKKAGELTLMSEHKDDFWLWVSSWAVFITEPADLGHDNEGYALPQLDIKWHEVSLNEIVATKVDRDGVQKLYADASESLPMAARIKQASIGVRIDKAFEIIGQAPEQHYILWHHLENERKALSTEFATIQKSYMYADIYGNLHPLLKEERTINFSKGKIQILGTKPDISGVGCNFQKHCHIAIFIGITDSFDEWYQALRRLWRYGQKHGVVIHMIYVKEEYNRVQNLKRKWQEHIETRNAMREVVRKYGLSHRRAVEDKRRTFHTDRREVQGKAFTYVNNDCVREYSSLPDNMFDMHLSSFPFGNHYEYTAKFEDFGHNNTNAAFIQQLDHLIPELLRTLKPGRICAVHLKNRIHYGSVTGLGFSVMHRFTHLVCDAMERGGFHTMGFHYVPTDVVGENNQTYRLTYGEMRKDSTKMGAGIPEEIWIFRKAPTSNDNAYADEPVMHNTDYTLADWQLDADSFWQSNGNRYLTPEELLGLGIDKLQAWWKKHNKSSRYDHKKHVAFLQLLDQRRKLSRTFTTLPLQSNTPFIMDNVNRMHGLNLQQRLRKRENHICPMPFDEVDRLIELYTNPGDMVSDPFGGLGTTSLRAIKKGRKAYSTELNDMYFDCGGMYLREEEQKQEIPTLFEFI